MRSLAFIFLSLATLAAPLVYGEDDWAYTTYYYFSASNPVRYAYEETSTADASVGTALVTGEAFRVALVRDTRADKTTDPFTLDAAGNLIPAEGLTAGHMAWATSFLDDDSVARVTTTPGVPGELSGTAHRLRSKYVGPALAGDDVTAAQEPAIYAYLVVLDTRSAEGTADTSATRVARYAVRKCDQAVTESPVGASYIFSFGVKLNNASYPRYELPGLETASDGSFVSDSWKAVAQFASLTITNEDGSQTTLSTPEEIEAYLTPTLSGFSTTDPSAVSAASLLTTEADGSAAFYLSASSPDLCFYALETKESLNDAAWKPFNDLLTEKGVDNASQKDYTRCRIDGRSPLTIPVFSGETGRFYRLRMVNQ
ncbi:MAG: hypothetical protein ACI4W7_01750 [Candidatus Spyradenecus sp.]